MSEFRQLPGLGVSGLLSENSTVLYANLFSQKHIGRVSDLLAAKLKPGFADVRDELRLRALLLFSTFEAWRARMESGSLGEPLELECGFDEERIVIGVSFKHEGALPDAEQGFLLDLRLKSDQLILRTHRAGGILEVVSVLKLSGEGSAGKPAPVLTAEVTEEKELPVSEYIELGDLDYAALLAEDGPAAQALQPPRAGEVIAKGFAEADELHRIKGEHDQGPHSVRVKGNAEKEDDREIRISGTPASKEDETEIRIESGSAPPVEKKKKGFLSRMLSFGQEEKTAQAAPEEALAAPIIVASVDSEPVAQFGPTIIPATEMKTVDDDAATSVLLTELQQEMGGIDQTLSKAQVEVNDIKKERPDRAPERARRWAEGLMGELLLEKARLHELAKKLNQAVRQKELHFRNQERAFQQEIHAREETVKQKTHQLNRAKEQLTQANMTIERLKGGTIAGADEAHFKQKFAHVQKLFVNAKDENVIMKAQLEDAKSEMNNLKQTVKRQNQMLAERPLEKKKNELQRAPNAAGQAGAEELKKKLDLESRKMASAQKEAEMFKLKFEEAQKEETRLKAEILRLQRQVANPGSSGGSGMGRGPAKVGKPGAGKPPKAA